MRAGRAGASAAAENGANQGKVLAYCHQPFFYFMRPKCIAMRGTGVRVRQKVKALPSSSRPPLIRFRSAEPPSPLQEEKGYNFGDVFPPLKRRATLVSPLCGFVFPTSGNFGAIPRYRDGAPRWRDKQAGGMTAKLSQIKPNQGTFLGCEPQLLAPGPVTKMT